MKYLANVELSSMSFEYQNYFNSRNYFKPTVKNISLVKPKLLALPCLPPKVSKNCAMSGALILTPYYLDFLRKSSMNSQMNSLN